VDGEASEGVQGNGWIHSRTTEAEVRRRTVKRIWTIQRAPLHPFVVHVVAVDCLRAITMIREGKVQFASRDYNLATLVCASMMAALRGAVV
jgi:hypothetical protein